MKMDTTLARTIVVTTALVCVTSLAVIDLLKGGDGATITGAFTAIGALVGFEFGNKLITGGGSPAVTQ